MDCYGKMDGPSVRRTVRPSVRPSVTLWSPKDNLRMAARILMKFGIPTYFKGTSAGSGARQNPRIFNEAAAL